MNKRLRLLASLRLAGGTLVGRVPVDGRSSLILPRSYRRLRPRNDQEALRSLRARAGDEPGGPRLRFGTLCLGDMGDFGAGSQIAWNVQATVGVNITRQLFAELGYRYMYVNYTSSDFLYKMNSYGLYSGFGVRSWGRH